MPLQPGSDILISRERVWAAAGVGQTLSSSEDAGKLSATETGEACGNAAVVATGAGNTVDSVPSGALDLELRRARAAAAAEARFRGSGSNPATVELHSKRRKTSTVETNGVFNSATMCPLATNAYSQGADQTLQAGQQQRQQQHQRQQRQQRQRQGRRAAQVWVCGRCTLINDASAAECVACAEDRPLPSTRPTCASGASAQIPMINLVASSGSDDDKE